VDLEARQGGARRSRPGDGLLGAQPGEEFELLLEQAVVVGQVEAEQREGLRAGPAPEDHLGAP
jgi:hypothetical protein